MGFKDAEWAYTLDLPMREKTVLVAICHRTADKTHETIVGQDTIAQMLGMHRSTVNAALGVLERRGVLHRERRIAQGFRTSDRTVINRAYVAETDTANVAETNVGDSNVGETNVGDSADQRRRERQQIELRSIDHSEGHSVIPADRFDEFYEAYPRKAKKPDARRAWEKAIKRAEPDHIIGSAIAYRDNPIPEHKKSFIPYPATWLNADAFNDPLPDWYAGEKPTPTSRALGVMQAGQNLINARQTGLATVTTLNPRREISK